MPPRLPRRVPWTSVAELDQICSWIYADENDLDSKLLAIQKISAWKAVTALPHAIESTLSLLVVTLEDKMPRRSSFSLSLRQNYAAAMIRLVNGLVDPLQSGAYARSIASISDQLGLPLWLVELRHASTHEDLPSLELLQEGARQSMVWLLQNYWLPTISPYTAPKTAPSLRKLGPVLKEYKRLLKATTRDHSLKATYQSSVTKVVREVERWLGEAKVAADMEWEGGDTDSKETFALEKLSEELLQKGVLVPLSKKKRVFSDKSFLPSTTSIDIWAPLILQIQNLHSDFCSVFVQRVIQTLLGDPSEPDDLRSPSYDACIARWAMWNIESCFIGDTEVNVRKDSIVSLIMTLGPKTPPSRSIAMQLLQALCEGDKQYEAALSYLTSQDVQASTWQTNDIYLMNSRLEELLELTVEDMQGIEQSEAVSGEGHIPNILAPGWAIDSSRWKPSPLGVHSLVI